MIDYLRHHFELAMPLVGAAAVLAVLVFGAFAMAPVLWPTVPTDGFALQIGDGVDELFVMANVIESVLAAVGSRGDIIVYIAIAATAVSLIAILWHLMVMANGPYDVIGFFRYMAARLWPGGRLTSWGVVRESQYGGPLAFARVRLASRFGHFVSATVADIHGRYGFAITRQRAVAAGMKLEASKDGHYFPAKVGPFSRFDIAMDSVRPRTTAPRFGAVAQKISGAAFWASVAASPFAAMSLSGLPAVMLAGAFALTVFARIVGVGRARPVENSMMRR